MDLNIAIINGLGTNDSTTQKVLEGYDTMFVSMGINIYNCSCILCGSEKRHRRLFTDENNDNGSSKVQ